MAFSPSREPRDVLDQAIGSKALVAEFFEYLSREVPGVNLRQAFQGFARDEREQRKILVKYRQDLYGPLVDDANGDPVPVVPDGLPEGEITARSDLIQALRTVIHSEDRATRFYTEAALNFADRHAKIFFRILAESGKARRDQLSVLLVAIERDGLQHGTVEPLQLQPTG